MRCAFDFSFNDIIKFQNDKYFEITQINFENYEEYLGSLTDEQIIIKNFDKHYDLPNEIFYEKLFCSQSDIISKDVSICICNLYKSISWFYEEVNILNINKPPETTQTAKVSGKSLKKKLNYIKQYGFILDKYVGFWNKTLIDLVNLYIQYSQNCNKEYILHTLIIASSLIKDESEKQDAKKIIKELNSQWRHNLNINSLKTLLLISITVKTLLAEHIGNTREFVMDKIVTNRNLKQFFFI